MSAEDELYDQLNRVMEEARNLRREGFEESMRRGKAERDAIEAIRRAKAAERSYSEVLKEKQELEKKMKEQDEVMQEVQIAMESQISESVELEKKIISSMELLKTYKKERDDLQIEFENALKVAEELRQNQAAETSSSTTYLPQFISEFSFAQIEEATRNFHPSLKIGEGGYGSVYKGQLGQTQVAIKKLHSHGFLQGPSKYQQEVKVLGTLKHPNLINLIGSCQEVSTLIYEYLPNGSLEDRLNCRDNSSPLSWQTRIRIAAELCSVLVFLHSSKPHSIVHGDLKPGNVLLDANFMSKLSDFGLCRVMSHDGNSSYIDPEFLTTGEINSKSDNDSSSSTNSLSYIAEFLTTGDLTRKSDNDNSSSTNSLSYIAEFLTTGDLTRKSDNDISSIGSRSCYNIQFRATGDLTPKSDDDDSSSTNSLSYIAEFLTRGDLAPNSDNDDSSSTNSLSYIAEFLTRGDLAPNSDDDNSSSSNTTWCDKTGPQGTFGYIDPEILTTGKLTPESDVYSFGIILLQLLTGRPAFGLANEVQCALENRDLKSFLDYSAGDWPYAHAQQLAHLGLRCAEVNRRNRPDIGLDVWRVLELMRTTSGGASSSLRPIQAPSYFICPILMDVMQDPHVAADGFTYEAESIKGWFHSEHDTSPMTNVQLEHTNLVPNLALRSAIQEWLEEQ